MTKAVIGCAYTHPSWPISIRTPRATTAPALVTFMVLPIVQRRRSVLANMGGDSEGNERSDDTRQYPADGSEPAAIIPLARA